MLTQSGFQCIVIQTNIIKNIIFVLDYTLPYQLTMEFQSRKDNLFAFIFIVVILLLLGMPVFQFLQAGWTPDMWFLFVNLAVAAFLLWLWYGTRYRIDDTHIHYRSGPFRGKIAIAAIREVQRDTTLWVGFRPALARKGIIVKYNKYNEIYFSPDNNDTFINSLLQVNAEISITVKV